MSTIQYIFLIGTAILGGLSVLAFKIQGKALKLILSFSGAYLFAISVLHLIPEIYSEGTNQAGVFILVGFFLQILLEYVSEGIEHGHIHIHHHEKAFPLTMMLGLCIHSFVEGMPLVTAHLNETTQHQLLIGIIMHNIPIAIALMSMLIQSEISKTMSVIMLLIFAAMAPLGALTSSIIGDNLVQSMPQFYNAIMGIVVGIFLHISTTILFENSDNHRFNLIKFITIILGALSVLLIS